MKSGVSIVNDGLQKFQKSLAALVESKVLVGVPSSKAERKPEDGEPPEINNAVIGYWMENGVPEKNIPARPFLIPGVRNAEKQIGDILKSATLNALAGDMGQFKNRLNAAGLVAVAAVQNKIDDGPFKGLADSTLRARARKQAVSGGTKADRAAAKAALATGNYSGINAQPLIDTGQLLRAITYIIRKK